MVGVLGLLVRDAVVEADPLVAVVVGAHAVVEHVASLLDELGQVAARLHVLRVLLNVTHHQDNLLAHDGALDGRVAAVQQVSLVLLYRLLRPVLQDLPRGRVLQAEGPFHHLVRL